MEWNMMNSLFFGRIQQYDIGSAVGVTLNTDLNYMMNYNTIGLTGDFIGSIYYTNSYKALIQRLIPGVSNASIVVDGSLLSPNSLSYFQGCRFDTNESLYTISANMIIKFDPLLNTC